MISEVGGPESRVFEDTVVGESPGNTLYSMNWPRMTEQHFVGCIFDAVVVVVRILAVRMMVCSGGWPEVTMGGDAVSDMGGSFLSFLVEFAGLTGLDSVFRFFTRAFVL